MRQSDDYSEWQQLLCSYVVATDECNECMMESRCMYESGC